MELITFDFNNHYSLGGLVAALGEFDGMHRAHQILIEKTVEFARNTGCKSAVFSFDPHPDFVLKKRTNQGYITPLSVKIKNLEAFGIDYFIILPFTETFSQMKYRDFEENVLGKFDIKQLVVGFDYRYGYKGEGNSETLKERFSVFVQEKIVMMNQKIGSNEIREHLLLGNMEKVTAMLGRYYRIEGKVIEGDQVGQRIGIRTANIALDEAFQVLRKGVYAVWVFLEGNCYQGVCNIGHNPSINFTEQPRLEVHIIDFSKSIYGQMIAVDFVSFLRDEKTYGYITDLVAQIRLDIENAKTILKKE